MIHKATFGPHGETLVGRPRSALYHDPLSPVLGLCTLSLGLIPPLSLQGLSLHRSQHHFGHQTPKQGATVLEDSGNSEF